MLFWFYNLLVLKFSVLDFSVVNSQFCNSEFRIDTVWSFCTFIMPMLIFEISVAIASRLQISDLAKSDLQVASQLASLRKWVFQSVPETGNFTDPLNEKYFQTRSKY